MAVTALEIMVSAYAGETLPVPLTYRLEGRAGITIGRNPSNDLVLDDPARQVSRFQAKVSAKRAGVELSNVSSQSCVLVNGEEIKPGGTARIQIGDSIVMGRFLLELRACDPVADQVDEVDVKPAVEPAIAAEPISQTHPTPVEPGLQIPDDYDVFAAPQSEQAQPPELQVNALSDFNDSQSQALLQELESVSVTGPDSLLDEKPAAAGALLGLVEEKLDPMQLFGMTPSKQTAPTLALDHTPEMERHIKLPGCEELTPAQQPESDSSLPTSAPSLLEESPELPLAAILQTAPQPPEPAPGAHIALAAAPLPPAVGQDESVSPADNQSQSTSSLLDALAKGAGLPVEALPALTPELMLELGTILKAMSDGTVKLMHSRSMTKHEMRANVTIIASAGNNPIKFAPDGTAALQQMLGKRFSGFMQPLAAIEDAFDDLSAHQLGLLAGARRAALELIEKLNPDQTLEEHETSGVTERLLPFVKEARLWRRHKRRYKKIADDQEGLASLIEKSFVRSYEEEIERIYAGRDR